MYKNFIPVPYRDYILDFYKDDDGWWIIMDANSPYILKGYYAEFTIHESSMTEAIRQFENHISHRRES